MMNVMQRAASLDVRRPDETAGERGFTLWEPNGDVY